MSRREFKSYFEVSTASNIAGIKMVRFQSVDQPSAVQFAQRIYKNEDVIPDVEEITRVIQ